MTIGSHRKESKFKTFISVWMLKWGGLSSKELDEAVMLEAAIFGEATSDSSKYLQSGLYGNAGPSSSSGSHTSPSSAMTQQSLREQQVSIFLYRLHV